MSGIAPELTIVAGARPNFVKVAPVLRAAARLGAPYRCILVHTGQHSSPELSQVFFDQLEIPPPHQHLGVGGGTHAEQTARILVAFETLLRQSPPGRRAVMVVGDVDSTLAAALAAAKLHVPVIHLEAGLRSGDRDMPEEINRLATDAISDLLLVSEPAGTENLCREGVPPDRQSYVGNVMIDSLAANLERARALPSRHPRPYAWVTLHRPSNVDAPGPLTAIVEFLKVSARTLGIVFPVHPRTATRLREFNLWDRLASEPAITLLPPQGYLESLSWLAGARVALTDSGGIQEEATFLDIPCLTLRENTERPSTAALGTNALVWRDFDLAHRYLEEIVAGRWRHARPIPGWDGHASERVIAAVADFFAQRFPDVSLPAQTTS